MYAPATQILTLHRTMYPIKRLYIWMGGDIGNGTLHDSPNSNELFREAQVHFSYHMFKFGLDGEFWKECFPHSELHGGGPPEFVQITEEEAKSEFTAW
jgi:hypothetical protein